MKNKICSRCHKIGEFYFDKFSGCNYGYCKKCQCEIARVWQKKNRLKHNASVKKSIENHPNRVLVWRLRKQYKFNEREVSTILKWKKGRCGICRKRILALGRGKKSACLDHCHKTNRFRGFLCNACNVGIGQLRDSIKILKLAIRYLNNHAHN